MDMILNKDFLEMNPMEMEEINGGDGLDALAVGAGTTLTAWSIPVGMICPAAGGVMACFGIAMSLIGCDVNIEFIKY